MKLAERPGQGRNLADTISWTRMLVPEMRATTSLNRLLRVPHNGKLRETADHPAPMLELRAHASIETHQCRRAVRDEIARRTTAVAESEQQPICRDRFWIAWPKLRTTMASGYRERLNKDDSQRSSPRACSHGQTWPCTLRIMRTIDYLNALPLGAA